MSDAALVEKVSGLEKATALMDLELKHHVEVCGERYKGIQSSTDEIKRSVYDHAREFKGSVSRLHERQDETQRFISDLKADLLVAIQANKAHGLSLKVWVLMGVMGAAPILFEIIQFVAHAKGG